MDVPLDTKHCRSDLKRVECSPGDLPELVIILVVALIVFGPQKLPEVGSSVGKAMREFRRATSELEEAVMHHDPSPEPDEEIRVPIVPVAPDTTAEAEPPITPTIDTLSMRREARLRARQEAAQPVANGDDHSWNSRLDLAVGTSLSETDMCANVASRG